MPLPAADSVASPSRAIPPDANGLPLVSVVIPVYNQAAFVPLAVESVLSQDYQELELIVVDDGSTDGTSEILSAHPGRFRMLRQTNHGAAVALNRGIRESRGSLVCWLSADDIFLPGKIRRQVEAFSNRPELGLVYTGYERMDAAGRVFADLSVQPPAHTDPYLAVFWQNSINGSSVMMRRAVFETCGPFDETIRADVDADMWLRVTQRYPIARLDGAYLRYRVHRNALSANSALMAATMTEVRRRYVDSGTLRARAIASDPNPARLLSVMAFDFVGQGLPDLAEMVLAESRACGRSLPTQTLAAARCAAERLPRGGLGRLVSGPVRRSLDAFRRRLPEPLS